MKKSTATVPKSADEPDKQKDPPPPPDSEKNQMKKSTAIVPKSSDEPDKQKSDNEPNMNKDPPPLSPPKVKRKLISQMSEASHIPLCMKQASEADYEFIPVYMEGEEPSPKRGSEAPQTPVRKTGPDRYENILLEDEFTN
eukprot:scaffold10242_cov56-Attheya_sp.AAC.2